MLKHDFKEIAIAFYLWCNNENEDYHDIDAKNVDEIIPQWEHKDFA